MKKFILILILTILTLVIFNNYIISKYFVYKFSKWIERDIRFDQQKAIKELERFNLHEA